MRHAGLVWLTIVLLASSFNGDAHAQTGAVSGGMDIRATAQQESEPDLAIEGLFLNLRHVFRDELGDRWIAVAQGDADDNFERVRLYQTYLQYKGPLGRWNLRAGHFLLPFGLLADYDTERLVLNASELQTIGIKLDTGVEALGYAGAWDWAVSASSGVGRRWPDEPGDQFAATVRIARGSDTGKIGLSALAGTILTDPEFPEGETTIEQRKAAVDGTLLVNQWSLRMEASGGTEDGRSAAGAVALASYGVRRWLDLDGKYSVVARGDTRHTLGVGVSMHLRRGFVLRPAGISEFTREGTRHGLVAQLYFDFAKSY